MTYRPSYHLSQCREIVSIADTSGQFHVEPPMGGISVIDEVDTDTVLNRYRDNDAVSNRGSLSAG